MARRGKQTQAKIEHPRPLVRSRTSPRPAAMRVAGARGNPSAFGHDETAPQWLRAAAGWSWRLIIVAVAVALVFWATGRVLLLFVALFLALVFTAVLRPLVNVLDRSIPRGLATTIALTLSIVLVLGLIAYVALSVAGEWQSLGTQFNDGITTLLNTLENSRLHLTITNADFNSWIESGRQWVMQNSSTVASQALASAGSVGEVFATFALAIFSTVFFLTRGATIWEWFLNQLPQRTREPWLIGGDAAWSTFSGYTRGIVIVAASDALFAGIGLAIIGVPLFAPLAVLVFIGAFIPLVGAPLAMVIAMIVALAAKGVFTAILVGVVIFLIGQFEGNVLQPLVMGKQVSLHPLVVALGVTAGTLVAGILGAVVAVPLLSVAWAVFSKLRQVDPPTDFSIGHESSEHKYRRHKPHAHCFLLLMRKFGPRKTRVTDKNPDEITVVQNA